MDDLNKALAGLAEVAGPVRPGDTLIFRLDHVTREQFDEYATAIADALRERIADVHPLFVAGVAQVLVYRPESD